MVLSALLGAGIVALITNTDDPPVEVAAVKERTAIQQVAFPATDTLQPHEPVAAGHTSGAVARVVVKSGSQSRLGSGVVLRSGHTLLTAADLVVNAERVTVVFELDDRRPATVAGIDDSTGLAVLRFEGDIRGPAMIGSAEKLADEAAVNLLIGTGMTPLMAPTQLGPDEATISVRGNERGGLMQATPPRAQGVIGAAVLNSQGTLVAVVTHVDGEHCYLTPIEVARRIEADISEFGTVRRAAVEVSLGNYRSGGVASGVEVLDIPQGSAQGGLFAVGDVITLFAGVEVNNTADLSARLSEIVPGTQVAATVVAPDGTTRTVYMPLAAAQN